MAVSSGSPRLSDGAVFATSFFVCVSDHMGSPTTCLWNIMKQSNHAFKIRCIFPASSYASTTVPISEP